MPGVTKELNAVRAAVDSFMATVDRCDTVWTVPVRPGKWSPSQLLEHVARALEASALDLSGQRSGLPQLSAPLRFVARNLMFKRVLKNAAFPPARTNRAMDPVSGPPTMREGRQRLEAAWQSLELAVRRASGGIAESRVFGTVSLAEYLRFQELHTIHHRSQLPTA